MSEGGQQGQLEGGCLFVRPSHCSLPTPKGGDLAAQLKLVEVGGEVLERMVGEPAGVRLDLARGHGQLFVASQQVVVGVGRWEEAAAAAAAAALARVCPHKHPHGVDCAAAPMAPPWQVLGKTYRPSPFPQVAASDQQQLRHAWGLCWGPVGRECGASVLQLA